MRDDALRRRLSEAGEHFFPIRVERDKDGKDQKRPAVYWRQYQTEKPSDEETARWERELPVAGWALVCGATRLVCIDIEKHEPRLFDRIVERYPVQCRVASPNGGMHIWLRIRETNLNGSFPRTKKLTYRVRAGQPDLALAEVRGAGGYALLFGLGRAPADDWAPYEVSLSQYEALCVEMASLGDRPLPADRAPGGGFDELSTSVGIEQARLDLHVFVQAAHRSGLEYEITYDATYDDKTLFRAKCPVHGGESDNSLQFGVVDDGTPKFVLFCHAQHCSFQSIADSVGYVPPRLGAAAEVAFWNARPILSHINQFARARYVAPWAVLSVTIARVAGATDPAVVIPPTIGADASLNTFVALVGVSGGGKSTAMRASRDAVLIPGEEPAHPIGSGEGLSTAYVRRDEGELVQHHRTAVFEAEEIGMVTALKTRSAATLMPALRNAWSGGTLGNKNRDPKTDLPVREHTYRMSFIAGVQPGAADTLLSEEEASLGTPQRFLWARSADSSLIDDPAEAPEPWTWEPPSIAPVDDPDFWLGTTHSPLTLCETARREIVQAHLSRQRGEEISEALDGHLLLCRTKVAAVFALLDGRQNVTEEDWELAGIVMAHSAGVRASLVSEMRAEAARRNVARGRALGVQQAVAAEVVENRAAEKVAKRLDKYLADGEWMMRSELRRKLDGPGRVLADTAIQMRVESGAWEAEEVITGETRQAGTRYRLVK